MRKSDLANLLGISTRTIDRLEAEGIFTRDSEGYVHDACIRHYVDYLRRDEATRQARRALLAAQTADRRLQTRAKLSRLASQEEIDAFISGAWSTFLDAWRATAYQLFCAGEEAGLGDIGARRVAGGFESHACAWLAEARDRAREDLRELFLRLTDEARVEALLKQLDEECAIVEEIATA